MSKKNISVRLSDYRLEQLDKTCVQLGVSRSHAIDMALQILPELISGTSELIYDPRRLEAKLSGKPNE